MDLGKSFEVCFMEPSKEMEPLEATEGMASLEPKTPVAERENVNFSFDCDSPPTPLKSPPKLACFVAARIENTLDSADPGSLQTRENTIFNPSAPTGAELSLSPLCKKYDSQMRIIVARCLNFDSSVKAEKHTSWSEYPDSASDEEMLESIYENLLEVIVSEQMQGLLAKNFNVGWFFDDCKTPLSISRLNGTADSCPGAPKKPAGKSRNIDSGLCRRLF